MKLNACIRAFKIEIVEESSRILVENVTDLFCKRLKPQCVFSSLPSVQSSMFLSNEVQIYCKIISVLFVLTAPFFDKFLENVWHKFEKFSVQRIVGSGWGNHTRKQELLIEFHECLFC